MDDYKGYYINLDRSTERRANIEKELRQYNLAPLYARFPAADGNSLGLPSRGLAASALGCWISHCMLLKENIGGGSHLHVVEDDAVFTDCTGKVIRWVIQSGFLGACDIIYTDVSVPLRNDIYKSYKSYYDKAVTRGADGAIAHVKFEILDLSKTTWSSTTSFLVNKDSVGKLHDLLHTEMRRGPDLPIDLFLREKNYQGRLKVGCVFPFVTSLRLADSLHSIIDPRADRQPEVAAALGRYAFFIGSEPELCRAYLEKYVPALPPEDRLGQLLGRLLTHSITDNYRFF